ncbi:MAG: cytochrome c [Planctomycetes bacterium]|nr:cytochrome c [Planctomycetota bacterium]
MTALRPVAVLARLLLLSVAVVAVACQGQGSGASKPENVKTDPAAKAPAVKSASEGFAISGSAEAGKAVAEKKCKTCHMIDGKGFKIGPPMDAAYRAYLDQKMADYPKHVEELKVQQRAVYEQSKAAIEEIAATENLDERLYKWLKLYIRKPTFDRPVSKMSPVVVNDKQLEDIIAFLFSLPK